MKRVEKRYFKILTNIWNKDFEEEEKEITKFKQELNILESILVALTKRENLEKAHILKRKIERLKARLELMETL